MNEVMNCVSKYRLAVEESESARDDYRTASRRLGLSIIRYMIYIVEMSLNGSDWTPLTGGEIYLTEKGCREEISHYEADTIKYRVARYERKA